MKKSLILLIFAIVLCVSGCAKTDGKNSSEKKENSNNILLGCSEYIDIDGKKLLELESKEKTVSISEEIKLKIVIKRGSPNGMNIYILRKDDKFIGDLMCGEEISDSITDEYGMPLENNYYEIGLYDFDSDKIREIVFSIRNENGVQAYVYKIEQRNDNIIINYERQFVEEGVKNVEIDKLNSFKLK